MDTNANTYGIENTMPTVRLLAAVISAGANLDTNQDGAISAVEIFNAIQGIVIKALSNRPQSIELLKKEVLDLSEAEKAELGEIIKNEINMPSAKAEQLVQRGLIVFIDVADFIVDAMRPAEEFPVA